MTKANLLKYLIASTLFNGIMTRIVIMGFQSSWYFTAVTSNNRARLVSSHVRIITRSPVSPVTAIILLVSSLYKQNWLTFGMRSSPVQNRLRVIIINHHLATAFYDLTHSPLLTLAKFKKKSTREMLSISVSIMFNCQWFCSFKSDLVLDSISSFTRTKIIINIRHCADWSWCRY